MASTSAARARNSLTVRRPRVGDRLFMVGPAVAGSIVLIIIAGLFYELTSRSWSTIEKFGLQFIWTSDWNPSKELFGAAPFILGTLITAIPAVILSGITGVLVAIYLVEVAPPSISRPVSYGVELLAAIPSVVYGLWGIFVLGTLIHLYVGPLIVATLGWIPFFNGTPLVTGLFSAILILSIMILPTIMAVSRDVIQAVPRTQREGILALGATRWEMISLVVLPYARSGILGACILGLARAVGETLAVTLVIGNRVGFPDNLFAPTYTMASVIANQFAEAENEMHRSALLEVGLLLLVITFLINAFARLLVWRVQGVRVEVQE